MLRKSFEQGNHLNISYHFSIIYLPTLKLVESDYKDLQTTECLAALHFIFFNVYLSP